MIKNKNYEIGDIGKKICLISDIHYSHNYDLKIFDEIIINIDKNKPDYICITGDIVDDVSVLDGIKKENLTKFIKNLSLLAPVILSKGNHDETLFIKHKPFYKPNEDYFLSLNTIENVYYLNNKTLIRGPLAFTGISLDFDWYYNKKHEEPKSFSKQLDEKIKKIDIQKYNILLCHTPSCILREEVLRESNMISKFDLVLSGHIHNGLVFNFLDNNQSRGFVGPFNKFFPKYAKGKITKKLNDKDINLIICGGVIKFSEDSPKFFQKMNKFYPIHIDYIEV